MFTLGFASFIFFFFHFNFSTSLFSTLFAIQIFNQEIPCTRKTTKYIAICDKICVRNAPTLEHFFVFRLFHVHMECEWASKKTRIVLWELEDWDRAKSLISFTMRAHCRKTCQIDLELIKSLKEFIYLYASMEQMYVRLKPAEIPTPCLARVNIARSD